MLTLYTGCVPGNGEVGARNAAPKYRKPCLPRSAAQLFTDSTVSVPFSASSTSHIWTPFWAWQLFGAALAKNRKYAPIAATITVISRTNLRLKRDFDLSVATFLLLVGFFCLFFYWHTYYLVYAFILASVLQ